MSYRTLLLHLDPNAQADGRVALALRLAAQHGAHLIGLAATGLASLPAAASIDMPAWPELVDLARARLLESARASAQAFQDQAKAAGLSSFEVRIDEADPAVALVGQGCNSDLIVMGHAEVRAASHGAATELAQRVFMQSGRPVLILPPHWAEQRLGQHVLVAWSGTRESARALSDAMPVLRLAERVWLLNLDRVEEAGVSRLELNDLRHWLSRQGVQAACEQHSTDQDYAQALLQRAAGVGADLIVMGGYGHSRLAERALGGVTRSLLADAPLPLLISH